MRTGVGGGSPWVGVLTPIPCAMGHNGCRSSSGAALLAMGQGVGGGGMWGRQAWRNPTDTLGRAGGHHAGQHRAGVGVLGCSSVQPGLSWGVEDTEMRFCTQK